MAAQRTGSDLLVEALVNEGVDRVFGVPGEENLDIVESLRRSGIALIVTRHEQSAAFMAATYGRLTGKAGVCLTTLGPGALNLTTGAAYALLGAMPMVMITGQKPILKSRQAQFQIVDIVATMRPLTKFSRQIVSTGAIPTLVRNAFRIAQEERPGPVHLELPEDIAAFPAPDGLGPVPLHPLELPVGNDGAIATAAGMLRAAERPLVMIGAAGNRRHLVPALSDFVRRMNIPFFNTQMGKGAVDGNSGLYIGTAALSEGDYLHDAVTKADLILAIGHDVVEKPPFIMEQAGQKVIHVGYQPADIAEVYFPDHEVVGDIGASLARIAEVFGGPHPTAAEAFAGLRRTILEKVAADGTSDRFPLLPQRIVHDVRAVMPDDGVVALDNGMYKIWFARSYRTHIANTILLDNALATMGAGLPSAMAAAMLHPDRRVMAVCGDGGFMMNSQELETAIRLKLNLVVVILVDNAYGMIRWKQEAQGFADWGLTFGNPDFVTYAQAYGATGWKVESAGEFAPTLEQAFAQGGVHLVSVPVDYTENSRVFIEELRSHASAVEAD
jgi:acetolactate synthase-1/2/3 large subunit